LKEADQYYKREWWKKWKIPFVRIEWYMVLH
jgi:hypothetical protein